MSPEAPKLKPKDTPKVSQMSPKTLQNEPQVNPKTPNVSPKTQKCPKGNDETQKAS